MSQLKNLSSLLQLLPVTIHLIFCIVIEYQPVNAQASPNINSLPLNSSSSSSKNWLETTAPIVGGLASTIASIISIIKVNNVKEERIKLLKDQWDNQQKEWESKEQEWERKINEMEVQFKDKYNSGEDQKKLNTDFYALVFDELGDENMSGISELFRKDESRAKFISRLKQCTEKFESSMKAIDGLLSEDEDGKKILDAIVYESISKLCKGDNNEDFQKKCKHLYSYLRGWLVCSIRYQTYNLPVEWIKDKTLDNSEVRQALKNTEYFILNEDIIKNEYIPEESSRNLISQYIKHLLEIIEDEYTY